MISRHFVATVEDTVRLLNNLLQTDPVCIKTLFGIRVPANDGLYDTDNLPVSPQGFGVMGLINGIFASGDEGGACIEAVYNDRDGNLIEFRARGCCPHCGPEWSYFIEGLSRSQACLMVETKRATPSH